MGNKKRRKKRKAAQQRRVQTKKNISKGSGQKSSGQKKRQNQPVSEKNRKPDVKTKKNPDTEIKDKIQKEYGTDYISLTKNTRNGIDNERKMEIKYHKQKKSPQKQQNRVHKLMGKWSNAFLYTFLVMAVLIIAYMAFIAFIVPGFKKEEPATEDTSQKGITYIKVHGNFQTYEWNGRTLKYEDQEMQFDIKSDSSLFICLVDDVIPELEVTYDGISAHKWYVLIEQDGQRKAACSNGDRPAYVDQLCDEFAKYFNP